uniref:Uncharacterized protein n=1 Tax=Rodentolepis nana TaxID=102285 RepID=A0A0R3TF91_RODNA
MSDSHIKLSSTYMVKMTHHMVIKMRLDSPCDRLQLSIMLSRHPPFWEIRRSLTQHQPLLQMFMRENDIPNAVEEFNPRQRPCGPLLGDRSHRDHLIYRTGSERRGGGLRSHWQWSTCKSETENFVSSFSPPIKTP